jgi:hypothetical protein
VVYTIPLPFLERSKRLTTSSSFGEEEQPINVEADAGRKAFNTEPSAVAPDARVFPGCTADRRRREASTLMKLMTLAPALPSLFENSGQ